MALCAGFSVTGEGRAQTEFHTGYDSASVPLCEDSQKVPLESVGPTRGWALHLAHALCRCACRRCTRRTRLLRCVLGGAFGLQLLGVKDAVAAEVAIGEGLRLVLERIRRCFRAGVIYGEILVLLDQHELHVRSSPVDGARLHISSDAQTLGVRPIAHLV